MNTISGISFYDSLNKLSIGILLILPYGLCFSNPFYYIVAFFIGCIFQQLIRMLTKPLTLNSTMIKRASKDFEKDLENKNIKETYLKAYYQIANMGTLMNVPILEALENFYRNMFFIILLYLVLFLINCPQIEGLLSSFGNRCALSLYLIVAIFIDIFMWYHTQFKIYELIWEGKYFNKLINKENNEKSNY